MENENMDKIELTDEELMAVTGGEKITNQVIIDDLKIKCGRFRGANLCLRNGNKLCAWINNQCVPDPKKYEY